MYKEMFGHQGKTTKVIGLSRVKIYKELYEHITKLQNENPALKHDDYLCGNELAENIYKKKS